MSCYATIGCVIGKVVLYEKKTSLQIMTKIMVKYHLSFIFPALAWYMYADALTELEFSSPMSSQATPW